MVAPTREEKITDISRVWTIARDHGDQKLKFDRYRGLGGEYSRDQIYMDGDTWGDLCDAAGAAADYRSEPVADEIYFRRLSEFVSQKHRLPKTSEFKRLRLTFSKKRWANSTIFFEDAANRGFIRKNLLRTNTPKMESHSEDVMKPSTLPQSMAPTRVPPPPSKSKKKTWERINIPAHPYAPHHEQGVVAIFAILCSQGRIPWHILTLNSAKGIDAICADENGHELNVEFKLVLRKRAWNHSFTDIDCVICWRNDWPDFPKRVIELADLVSSK